MTGSETTWRRQQGVTNGCLDLALLTANAVVETPESRRTKFFTTIFALLIVSIILQVLVGVMLVTENLLDDDCNCPRGVAFCRVVLNKASVVFILIITIINVLICAFGVAYTDQTVPDK